MSQAMMSEDALAPPYPKAAELYHHSGEAIPGQPLIKQHCRKHVLKFLNNELSTLRLEALSWAFFLVSKRRNISPLHHQIIKGRQILITEKPDLHLIWHYNRIFIKPIPLCLFNHSFYITFLCSDANHQLRKDANGLLRTYASLIMHESDFNIAKDVGLIPPFANWINWCHFMGEIRHLSDSTVSRRYHYGEMRLTRLNFCHKLVYFGESYLQVHHQYLSFFSAFIGPYLFIFGGIAVILAAMQVALAADPESGWKGAVNWFCMLSVILSIVGLAFFPGLYLFFQLRELVIFIIYHQRRNI